MEKSPGLSGYRVSWMKSNVLWRSLPFPRASTSWYGDVNWGRTWRKSTEQWAVWCQGWNLRSLPWATSQHCAPSQFSWSLDCEPGAPSVTQADLAFTAIWIGLYMKSSSSDSRRSWDHRPVPQGPARTTVWIWMWGRRCRWVCRCKCGYK